MTEIEENECACCGDNPPYPIEDSGLCDSCYEAHEDEGGQPDQPHPDRVTELLRANNREVERRRVYKRALDTLVKEGCINKHERDSAIANAAEEYGVDVP